MDSEEPWKLAVEKLETTEASWKARNTTSLWSCTERSMREEMRVANVSVSGGLRARIRWPTSTMHSRMRTHRESHVRLWIVVPKDTWTRAARLVSWHAQTTRYNCSNTRAWNVCGTQPACACIDGYVRDDAIGKCVLAAMCTPPAVTMAPTPWYGAYSWKMRKNLVLILI